MHSCSAYAEAGAYAVACRVCRQECKPLAWLGSRLQIPPSSMPAAWPRQGLLSVTHDRALGSAVNVDMKVWFPCWMSFDAALVVDQNSAALE